MFEDLLTDRLCLRRLRTEDIEMMFAYRSNPKVIQYQTWEPKSQDEVRSFIDSMVAQDFNAPGWYQIGISLRSDGILIGDCGIHVLEDSRIVEIAVTIAPESQSKGYATETLNAILDLVFGRLCKHRVYASVDPRNLSSMALMKRIGLRQETHWAAPGSTFFAKPLV